MLPGDCSFLRWAALCSIPSDDLTDDDIEYMRANACALLHLANVDPSHVVAWALEHPQFPDDVLSTIMKTVQRADVIKALTYMKPHTASVRHQRITRVNEFLSFTSAEVSNFIECFASEEFSDLVAQMYLAQGNLGQYLDVIGSSGSGKINPSAVQPLLECMTSTNCQLSELEKLVGVLGTDGLIQNTDLLLLTMQRYTSAPVTEISENIFLKVLLPAVVRTDVSKLSTRELPTQAFALLKAKYDRDDRFGIYDMLWELCPYSGPMPTKHNMMANPSGVMRWVMTAPADDVLPVIDKIAALLIPVNGGTLPEMICEGIEYAFDNSMRECSAQAHTVLMFIVDTGAVEPAFILRIIREAFTNYLADEGRRQDTELPESGMYLLRTLHILLCAAFADVSPLDEPQVKLVNHAVGPACLSATAMMKDLPRNHRRCREVLETSWLTNNRELFLEAVIVLARLFERFLAVPNTTTSTQTPCALDFIRVLLNACLSLKSPIRCCLEGVDVESMVVAAQLSKPLHAALMRTFNNPTPIEPNSGTADLPINTEDDTIVKIKQEEGVDGEATVKTEEDAVSIKQEEGVTVKEEDDSTVLKAEADSCVVSIASEAHRFWTLDLFDFFDCTSEYKKALSSLSNTHETHNRILRERDAHASRIEARKKAMEDSPAPLGMSTEQFVAECITPRIVLSQRDAAYCFYFAVAVCDKFELFPLLSRTLPTWLKDATPGTTRCVAVLMRTYVEFIGGLVCDDDTRAKLKAGFIEACAGVLTHGDATMLRNLSYLLAELRTYLMKETASRKEIESFWLTRLNSADITAEVKAELESIKMHFSSAVRKSLPAPVPAIKFPTVPPASSKPISPIPPPSSQSASQPSQPTPQQSQDTPSKLLQSSQQTNGSGAFRQDSSRSDRDKERDRQREKDREREKERDREREKERDRRDRGRDDRYYRDAKRNKH